MVWAERDENEKGGLKPSEALVGDLSDVLSKARVKCSVGSRFFASRNALVALLDTYRDVCGGLPARA